MFTVKKITVPLSFALLSAFTFVYAEETLDVEIGTEDSAIVQDIEQSADVDVDNFADETIAGQHEPVVDDEVVVEQRESVIVDEVVVEQREPVIVDAVAVEQPATVSAVAVYMSGDEPAGARGAHRILGAELAKVITQSDAYSAVDRTEAILEQIDREHLYQRSGAVSDEDIKELGRQFGVRYVCVASVSEAAGGFFLLEARLVDVVTAEVLGVASVVSDLRDGREMIRTARRVAHILITGQADDDYTESVSKVTFSVDAGISYVATEFDDGLEGGGFQGSVGGEVMYRIEGLHSLGIAAGVGFLFDSYESDAAEFTVSDMALYVTPKYRLGGAQIYLEASVTISASFYADVEVEYPDGAKDNIDVDLSTVYSFDVSGRYKFAGVGVGRSFSDDVTLVGAYGYIPVLRNMELLPAFTYYIGDKWSGYALSLGARLSF